MLTSSLLAGQTKVSGKIVDQAGEPIVGANIYIQNTYDGASSNSEGQFSFSSSATGVQLLIISSIGYVEQRLEINCDQKEIEQNVVLKEAFNKLKAVSITAGSIEANDEERSVILKPLDIVTTAGALGDITGALSTLPGTATVGNDGRLFVRGGSAGETALFFDGLKVNNAYGSSLAGIPTRTRFSPQLFAGTFFSTGGYSAEYGQALSSVLVLNTFDMPLRTQTDLSLMTVGGAVSHTQVWNETAVTGSLNYLNLSPYQGLVPQNLQWNSAPRGLNSEVLIRQKMGKRALLKVFYANQVSDLSIYQQDPGEEEPYLVSLQNRFNYGNVSYEKGFGGKLLLNTGVSYSHNSDDTMLDSLDLNRKEDLLHAKLKLSYFVNPRLSIRSGVEYYAQSFKESVFEQSRSVKLPLKTAYGEANYHISDAIAVKAGLRGEYFNNTAYLMPRLSAALRLSDAHQLSLATGNYIQQQSPNNLVQAPNLAPSKSQHYIVNYQFNKDLRILRVEAYVKNYQDLVTSLEGLQSNGDGYARGVDLFYRDRKSIKNLDFWVTYSFIDSKRQYADFTQAVQPGFAPQHNVSIVGKYWISKLKSQFGFSQSLNDGYRYDNPNKPGEMESKTRGYNSLSLNWSYLPKQNLIIHFAVNNVLGTRNVFGYRYSDTPNAQNQFAEMPMGQAADRFFFIGVFYTLSSDKKANQLNNL
jgi:hypothetical protein